MSERDDDECPAGDPVDPADATDNSETSEAAADQPRLAASGPMPAFPEMPGVAGLAAAVKIHNRSAIDSIAKTTTALNGPALSPASDWQREIMPKLNMPKVDLPTFDMPKIDLPRQFDVSGYDFAARIRELMGFDSGMAGRNIADAYLRGIGDIGAGEAFTRAIEAIGGHQGVRISARDFSVTAWALIARDLLGGPAGGQQYGIRSVHDIATGPNGISRWLDRPCLASTFRLTPT